MLSRKAFLETVLLVSAAPLTGCQKAVDRDKSQTSGYWDTELTNDEWHAAIRDGQLSYTLTDLRIAEEDRDFGDAEILVVYYDFKNGTAKRATDASYMAFDVYQSGKRLAYHGITADGLTSGKGKETIDAGSSTSDYLLYTLNDSSPVTVKLAGKTVADNVPPDSLPHNS